MAGQGSRKPDEMSLKSRKRWSLVVLLLWLRLWRIVVVVSLWLPALLLLSLCLLLRLRLLRDLRKPQQPLLPQQPLHLLRL